MKTFPAGLLTSLSFFFFSSVCACVDTIRKTNSRIGQFKGSGNQCSTPPPPTHQQQEDKRASITVNNTCGAAGLLYISQPCSMADTMRDLQTLNRVEKLMLLLSQIILTGHRCCCCYDSETDIFRTAMVIDSGRTQVFKRLHDLSKYLPLSVSPTVHPKISISHSVKSHLSVITFPYQNHHQQQHPPRGDERRGNECSEHHSRPETFASMSHPARSEIQGEI